MAPINDSARILIVSDNRGEAESLRKLLDQNYSGITLSFDPEQAKADFENTLPDLIVLAFGKIEQAQRYYLGLYRFSLMAQSHPHRTVLLCGKEELRKAYELCCKRYFDDYVLFWPSPYDGFRLLMSVHVALRDLKDGQRGVLDSNQLLRHAEQLGAFEKMLDERLAEGGREVAEAAETMEKRSSELGGNLERLVRDLQRELDGPKASLTDPKHLEQVLAKLSIDELRPLITSGKLAIEPLRRWVNELQRESSTFLEQARSLVQLIQEVPRRILVVDDDEFSQKLVSRLLSREGYEPVCASTAAEALALVRKVQPAMILMDYMLPDDDGLSVTRRIKSVKAFADIPIIMLTGQRDRETVVNSLLAGACDFVGKPIDAVTLMAKVNRYLGNVPAP